MTKITYMEIYGMFGAQGQGPIVTLRDLKLPIKTSLKLRRIFRELEPLYKDVLEEQNKLVDELGEGTPPIINFGTPEFTEFERRMEEFNKEGIELDISPIGTNELDGVQLSVEDIELLEPILLLEE